MRTKLLLSTAVVALMLAGPAAFAQSNPDKKPDTAKEHVQKQEQRAQHQAEQNKAAESHQSKPDQNKAAQSEQPKPQQSASERQQHEQKNADKSAQRQMKEQQAQKQKAEHNKAATTKSRSTTGQNTTEQKPSDTQKNATSDQSKSSPSAAQQNDKNRQSATDNKANPTNNTANTTNNTNTTNSRNTAQQNTTNVNAQLTPEKQTRISETISRTHDVAPPVRDLRVSINIGTRVPERVHLHRLPTEIVSIEPAYREYDYFTTEQDIVIVNPHTRQVVTMIPRNGSSARAEVGGSSSTQVSSMPSGTSGSPPCQVMRREASGQTVPVNPSDLSRSTTGSGASDRNQLTVTVQAPNGQSMPPIALPDQTGQIVVATDGGDCKITIEPGAR
jgi:chemotaxis protein histidine kinase CheA